MASSVNRMSDTGSVCTLRWQQQSVDSHKDRQVLSQAGCELSLLTVCTGKYERSRPQRLTSQAVPKQQPTSAA